MTSVAFPNLCKAVFFCTLAMASAFCPRQDCTAAETNAVIPYSAVEKLLHVAEEANQTKLAVQVRITSAKVRSPDMHLMIQSRSSGAIPVKLGPAGEVVDFPRTEKLRREDPPILTDQPKGTLLVSLRSELPAPEALSFPYARLTDGLAEMKRITKAEAGMLSALAPSPQTVVFVFPKSSAGKAKVEITSAKEPKEWVADTNGFVKFTVEKSLIKENPQVRLSEKVEHIFPATE